MNLIAIGQITVKTDEHPLTAKNFNGGASMKVYIAAPYRMKNEIKARAMGLRDCGIEVTSSWLNEPHKPNTQMGDLTHEEHQKYALQDVQDVVAADILVLLTDPTKTIVRAGRHVEFGIAVGLGLSRP